MLDDHEASAAQTLKEAIKAAWTGSDSNDEATDKLVAAARANNDVLMALVEPKLEQLARNAVVRHRLACRSTLWNKRPAATSPGPEADAEALETPSGAQPRVRTRNHLQQRQASDARRQGGSHSRIAARSILTGWRLSNGMRLGDASRADIQQEREMYERKGSEMLAKAEFYRLIEQAMPEGGGALRDSLTAAQVEAFKEAAKAQP